MRLQWIAGMLAMAAIVSEVAPASELVYTPRQTGAGDPAGLGTSLGGAAVIADGRSTQILILRNRLGGVSVLDDQKNIFAVIPSLDGESLEILSQDEGVDTLSGPITQGLAGAALPR